MARLESAAVVIAANQFNPSVFSELWLFRHDIATAEELDQVESKIFSEAVVQVVTGTFNLTILPHQLMFATKDPVDPTGLILERMGRLIDLVPHTPFQAVGVNFLWQIEPSSTRDMSKRLFMPDDSPLLTEFSSPDCFFGGYLSKDILNCRLKLNIMPTTEQAEGEKVHRLHMNFNFHKDIATLDHENRPLVIKQHLASRSEAYVMSKRIAESIPN